MTFLTNLPAIKDNFNKLSILEMKLEEVNDNWNWVEKILFWMLQYVNI